MSHHQIVHVELSANDREGAARFYHDLFGWETRQIPEMNYATFATGETGPGGGFNPVSADSPAGTVLIYIDTDDVTATLQRAVELGGTALVPRTEIPGVGWFGIFRDPTGNSIAVLEALPMA